MSATRATRRRAERAGKSPGHNRWFWIAAVGAGATALVGVAAIGASGGSPAAPTANASVSNVPKAGYETFDGESRVLASYEGQPLVVNFFASWCAPCLAEMPGFEEVYQRLGDEVAFLGLNLQDSVEDGLRVVDQTGITFDIGRDPTGAVFTELGGLGMPTTVLISADGEIVDLNSGAMSAETLEAKINSLLLGA